MSLNTYVQKRGSTYYFRRRVPGDVVEVYGKTEIMAALHTKILREANARAAIKAVETDREFDEIKNQNFDSNSDSNSVAPSHPDSPRPMNTTTTFAIKMISIASTYIQRSKKT